MKDSCTTDLFPRYIRKPNSFTWLDEPAPHSNPSNLLDNSPYLPAKKSIIITNMNFTLRDPNGITYHKPDVPPSRGVISEFSRKSSRRLKLTLTNINFNIYKKVYFFTCTYGKKFPREQSIINSDLRKLLKRIQRLELVDLIIWRKEIQKRGAPHYHFILCLKEKPGYKRERYIATALKQHWCDLTIKDNPFAGTVGSDFRDVNSIKKLLVYLCKYIAKGSDAKKKVSLGRAWSVVGRYEKANSKEILLTLSQMDYIRRTIESDYSSRFALDDHFSFYLIFSKEVKIVAHLSYIKKLLFTSARFTGDKTLELELEKIFGSSYFKESF